MSIERLEERMAGVSTAASERVAAEETLVTLERDFEVWKREQTFAMIGTENPLTAKPHSLTSASDGVRDLPDYAGWTVRIDRARLTQLDSRLQWERSLEMLRTIRVIVQVEASVAHV